MNIKTGIVVDGACAGNPGPSKYRGLDLETGEIVFSTFLEHSTNNICEFVALCHGIGYCIDNHLPLIYSDSTTALSWVKKKEVNSALFSSYTDSKAKIFTKRCLTFLKSLEIEDEREYLVINGFLIVKRWETKWWGENPADYGHKKVYFKPKQENKLSLSEIGNKIVVPENYYNNLQYQNKR